MNNSCAAKSEMKRIILLSKPYSNIKGDEYLKVVLAKYYGEYVTWVYNESINDYNTGHYFTIFDDALRDFINRGLAGLGKTAGDKTLEELLLVETTRFKEADLYIKNMIADIQNVLDNEDINRELSLEELSAFAVKISGNIDYSSYNEQILDMLKNEWPDLFEEDDRLFIIKSDEGFWNDEDGWGIRVSANEYNDTNRDLPLGNNVHFIEVDSAEDEAWTSKIQLNAPTVGVVMSSQG